MSSSIALRDGVESVIARACSFRSAGGREIGGMVILIPKRWRKNLPVGIGI